MVDIQFADPLLAELYDLFHPPELRADFAFYLPLVMSAGSVLDVGCGTGALLHAARKAGHTGRLVGVDPGKGMIEQAREHPGIEWVLGDLSTTDWSFEFDLVVMTGHAFQVLVEDAEIEAAFMAIRSVLREGGRFVFETRNPALREWEAWTADRIFGVTSGTGVVVLMRHAVESVQGDVVGFKTTFESSGWDGPKTSRSTLRFLDNQSLCGVVSKANLVIEEQFGDWDRRPFSDTSPEIITVTRS